MDAMLRKKHVQEKCVKPRKKKSTLDHVTTAICESTKHLRAGEQHPCALRLETNIPTAAICEKHVNHMQLILRTARTV